MEDQEEKAADASSESKDNSIAEDDLELFKKKEETAEEKEEAKEEKKEKENRKNKKFKEEENSSSEKDEEVEIKIDWKKFGNFFTKGYGWILLLLIPIFLTVSIRIQPNQLAVTTDWATSTVYNYYKNMISQEIAKNYPNLPDANKQSAIDQQFSQYLTANGPTVKQQISETAKYFKDKLQYDSNGTQYTYLGDLDSYYFLRYADNYLKTGIQGDEIRNGVQWDTHMYAPIGGQMSPTLHPYSIAFLYKFLHMFNQKMTTMQASFYVPLLCAIIAAIAAFMIGKRIAGNFAGLASSVLLSINPMFLSRTLGSDTDVYNVMFPLLIIWMIVEAFEAEKNKNKAIFAGLSGLFMGIFSFAWSGWWYIFDFMMAALGLYIIYLIIASSKKARESNRKHLKTAVITTAIIIASSALFVTIFSSASNFLQFALGPFSVMGMKSVAHATLWPNVYLTVAELNPGDFSTVLEITNGAFFLIIAVIGTLLTFLKKDRNGHYDIKMAALLLIWFIGTYFATLKGMRFALLLVPAFAIAAGAAFGFIFNILTEFSAKELKIGKFVPAAVIAAMLALMVITPVRAGYSTGKNYVPSMNDAWYDDLSKIKADSQPDAIINSWWDFGHWFKYVADRAVTADGASQNSPQAYWLGRILVTDNEDEAIAVLRMLDCGSNTAFETIDAKNNDTGKTIAILQKEIMMNHTAAEKYLSTYLNKSDVDKVLNSTHCNPPEDYFITSEDMVGKSGVWAHFGLWDFDKARIVNLMKENPEEARTALYAEGYNNSEIEKTLYQISSFASTRDEENWISPWPGYISSDGQCSQESNDTILCNNNINGQIIGIRINTTSIDAEIVTGTGAIRPKSFVYFINSTMVEKEYENDQFGFSVILSPEGHTVITSPELSRSIFTRLFFLKGAGLSHFKAFDQQTEITGGQIYTWKVEWQ